jgi:hypothetical protein
MDELVISPVLLIPMSLRTVVHGSVMDMHWQLSVYARLFRGRSIMDTKLL